jgi:RND superfamily putative drug exporter
VRTLARFSFRRRRLVLGLWLAVLALVASLLAVVGAGYDDTFALPDTESSRAFELLQRVSPDASGDTLTAVFAVPDGHVADPAPRAGVEAVLTELRELHQVVAASSPYDNPQQVSRDGRIAFATITLTGQVPADLGRAEVDEVLEVADRERSDLRVEVTGQAASGPPEQGKEELVGLTAAAIVLFLVFGSLVAMSLPLITAVLSIAVSLSLVGLLATC